MCRAGKEAPSPTAAQGRAVWLEQTAKNSLVSLPGCAHPELCLGALSLAVPIRRPRLSARRLFRRYISSRAGCWHMHTHAAGIR